MESDRSCEENTVLINELIQGMEVATKLKEDLKFPCSGDDTRNLVQRILSSYDKALLILKWNESSNSMSLTTMHQATQTESPISLKSSPPNEYVDGSLKDHQEPKQDKKKRKMTPKWMDKVRVNSENGFEGSHDDGYSWRKYGQKDILGSKYPRSYYRCTFRNTKGCWATKQVQRSDEDPNIFDITYRGSHACSQRNNAVLLPPKSPDIQEKPHSHNSDIHHGLTVNTDNPGNEEMAWPFTSPSTSFECMTQENLSQTHLPPITPESNDFPFPSFQISEFDDVYNKPRSGSDIAEIISANTSATSSPIFHFNFSLDPVEIDSNFPFNASGFLF